MNTEEARWRQRFENFSRAYQQLDMAVRNFENLSVLEKAAGRQGIIRGDLMLTWLSMVPW